MSAKNINESIPPRPKDKTLGEKYDRAMEALRKASEADQLAEQIGRDRKTRARRIYIIGAELMRRAVSEPKLAAIVDDLKSTLTRPDHRKAFGLAVVKEGPSDGGG